MDGLSKEKIKIFQREILDWYSKNKRDLPWRKTRDPYKILVSEIMLQQTQVSRVIPKYEAWLQAFPDVERLANAKTSEVLRLWSGLGYNRRALYLQKAAQEIVKNYSSSERSESRSKGKSSRQARTVNFPRTVEELKKLSGIGEYTAAAVACFAFNEQVAVVDTNIRKVILVRFCHPELVSGSKKINRDSSPMAQNDIKTIADQILPKEKAYEWNQALMDYASAMLKKEKISLVKQSTFKGSNRYYRGQIIKVLIKEKDVSIDALMTLFQKDREFVEKITQGLVKDGLIKIQKAHVFFT